MLIVKIIEVKEPPRGCQRFSRIIGVYKQTLSNSVEIVTTTEGGGIEADFFISIPNLMRIADALKKYGDEDEKK